jgi:hypothetical protein
VTRLWAGRPKIRGLIPGRGTILAILNIVQVDTETHQSHIQWIMATLSQGTMRAGREVDNFSSTVKAVNE